MEGVHATETFGEVAVACSGGLGVSVRLGHRGKQRFRALLLRRTVLRCSLEHLDGEIVEISEFLSASELAIALGRQAN